MATQRPRPDVHPPVIYPGENAVVSLRFTNFGRRALEGARLRFVIDPRIEFVEGTLHVNDVLIFGAKPDDIALPIIGPGDEVDVHWTAWPASSQGSSEGTSATISSDLILPNGQTVSSDCATLTIERDAQISVSASFTCDASNPDVLRAHYLIRNDGWRDAPSLRLFVPVPDGCLPDPDLGETEGCSRTNPIYVSAQQNAIVEFGFPIIHDVVDTTLAVGPAGLCQGARFLQEIPGAEVELPRRRVLQGDFRLDSDLLVVGNAYDLILDMTNTDPRAIEGVVVALRLSEDASLIPDTVTLDARCAHVTSASAGDDSSDGYVGEIAVGRIPGGKTVALRCKVKCERTGPIALRADCAGGVFEYTGVVRALLEFAPDQNYLRCDSLIVAAGERTSFDVVITNTGTTAARVQLRAQSDRVAWDSYRNEPFYDRATGVSMVTDIGEFSAGESRVVRGSLRLPWWVDERAPYEIPVFLQADDIPEALVGVQRIEATASVSFQGSKARRLTDDVIRSGQSIPLAYVVRNNGWSTARGILLHLELPSDVEVTHVDGVALSGGSAIELGDLVAGAARGLTITTRFTGSCEGRETRTACARLVAENSEPFTFKEVRFDVQSFVRLTDQRVSVTMLSPGVFQARAQVRNAGDGYAANVWLRHENLSGYVPGSTRVQARPIADIAGEAPVRRKLVLDRVGPGQIIDVEWQFMLEGTSPLPMLVLFGRADDDVVLIETPLPALADSDDGCAFGSSVIRVEDESTALAAPDQHVHIASDARSTGNAPDHSAEEEQEEDIASSAEPHVADGPPASLESSAEHEFVKDDEAQAPRLAWGQPRAEPLSLLDSQAHDEGETLQDTTEAGPPPKPSTEFPWPEREIASGASSAASVRRIVLATPWSSEHQAIVGQTLRDLCDVPNAGWYRHVMAMKVLFAQQLRVGEADVNQDEIALNVFASVRSAIRSGLGAPRMAMLLGDFHPTEDWVGSLGDDAVAESLAKLGTDFKTMMDEFPVEAEPAWLLGAVPAIDIENKGVLWAYAQLPGFIPTVCVDAQVSGELRSYRDLLQEFFGDLARGDHAEGLETMASVANAALDEELHNVVMQLETGLAQAAA